MALITCKECGKEVSSKAKACPSCGAKIPKKTSAGTWIVAGISLFGIVMCSVETQKQQSAQEAREAAMTPEERKAQADAKAAAEELSSAKFACQDFVKRSLDDPDSAQFERFETFPSKKLAAHEYFVQVNVRARNGFNALRQISVNCKVALRGENWVALQVRQVE